MSSAYVLIKLRTYCSGSPGRRVSQDRRMRVLKAGAVYFLLMFGVGWILGPIRELWAMPRFGRLTGVLLEAVIMLIAMAMSARWVIRRFHVKPKFGSTISIA